MKDNCNVLVMERRRALFDIDADDFCFTTYGNHIMKPFF